VTTHSHESATLFRIPGERCLTRRPFEAWTTLPAPRSRRAAVLGLPPRCRLLGPFETTQRHRQGHPTPNTQRPTGGPCHPTPRTRGRRPTPKSVNAQRLISNTQRPKIFFRFAVSSHMGVVGTRRGVWGSGGGSGPRFPPLWGRRRRGAGRRRGRGRRRGAGRRRGGLPARAARNRRREGDPTPPQALDPGAALPHTQRQTPNAQHPTPKTPNACE
jgi:hypothetical protein